jgi:protein gp37
MTHFWIGHLTYGWVLDIKDQCDKADVKFFFKQWGGFNKKKAGRQLEGKTYNEMPV